MNPSPPESQLLILTEYGTGEVELTATQERALRHLANKRLTILPADVPGRWQIRASSYVGTIVSPAVRILITPKVATANLFHLLETGGKALDIGSAVFGYDSTSDLIPSFATFYGRHLEAALAQGIPRDYREYQERLAGVRGRVDVPALRRLAGLPLPVECRFDEYTTDIPLNRILRGAATTLLRLPGVTITTRQTLQRLAARIQEAGAPTTPDLRSPTNFTRLTEHCHSAERLARMVLEGSTLLHAAGIANAGVFLIDMNKVFEEFVTARLQHYLAGQLRVLPQCTEHLDIDGNIAIRPDLMFKTPTGGTVYVADTKYKISSDGFGREADYYQILAYASAIDLPEGLLIYCQDDNIPPARQVTVRNLGTRLGTWAIRLDRSPADLEQEIRRLGQHIAARALHNALAPNSLIEK